jgi:hypothetical protein
MTVYTSLTACDALSSSAKRGNGKVLKFTNTAAKAITTSGVAGTSSQKLPAMLALAGMLAAGMLGWRKRKLRFLAGILMLAAVGFAATGCGGSSSSSTNETKGSYTLDITGTDSGGSISNSTTMTLTID